MALTVQGLAARILIVDDEERNSRLLEGFLRASGFGPILSTTTASDALDIVDQTDPDLLLLDLHMPHIDGFHVLEKLRSTPQTARIPVLVLTGDESREARERALSLGARDFLTKPFDRTEVALRVRNLLEMRTMHKELLDQNALLEKRVRQRTADLWSALQSVEKSEQDLRRSQVETVTRLSMAADFRDDETGRHIQRMSRYCEMLARVAGIDDSRSELIRVASMMHDIGKIGIPDAVLRKPGLLTDTERAIMQEHATIGFQILSGSDSELLKMAAIIALGHHERFDGKGYPHGRSGNEIPLEARIAAIADVFDALTTDRVYRKALPFTTAINMLRQGKGTQFDPILLDLFFAHIDQALRIKEELEEAAA